MVKLATNWPHSQFNFYCRMYSKLMFMFQKIQPIL